MRWTSIMSISFGTHEFPKPSAEPRFAERNDGTGGARRPLQVRKFFALLLLVSAAASLGGWRLLLLLRPAALGGWRLLLLLRPAPLGGWRLLLLLRPASLGGWRLLLLLRPAALGGWRLLGSPALQSRLLRLIWLLLTLLTLLLLLIAAGWSLTGRRFPSALTRSAWRIVTEPTPLTGCERLCWRHILAWLNDVLRFTHRYLSALSSSLSKILWPYFHRTLNLRASRQDARPHLKGAEWSCNCCCDNRWSNPWVDGDRGATLTHYDRLVHHNSLVDENVLLARRQNDAHETGCDEIAGPHENPHIGLVAIFDHDLVPEPRNAFNYR
jgi:hypothetical protein